MPKESDAPRLFEGLELTTEADAPKRTLRATPRVQLARSGAQHQSGAQRQKHGGKRVFAILGAYGDRSGKAAGRGRSRLGLAPHK